MHSGKNCILKLKTDSKNVNKKHILDLDVPKSNPHSEDENVSVMNLSLSRGGRQFSKKNMETLTPKRIFIGFLTSIKWLEPTKSLAYLI